MSSSWRTAPAFYRARYASLGSTQPLLSSPPRTARRDPRTVASFLNRYPTDLHSSKLRRLLLAAVCGLVIAWYDRSTALQRSSRRANRTLSREDRRPLVLLLRPLQDDNLKEAHLSAPRLRASRYQPGGPLGVQPPPNPNAASPTLSTNANEAGASKVVSERTGRVTMVSPPSRSSLLVNAAAASPRRRRVVPIESPLALRLARVHGWATIAIIIGGLGLATISVIGVIGRRRMAGRDEGTRRGAAGDDDDDDDDDDASASSDELYRVLHSSDPVAMGYGSFQWSPASTIISVEPASGAASSWTGDYFDKFDV